MQILLFICISFDSQIEFVGLYFKYRYGKKKAFHVVDFQVYAGCTLLLPSSKFQDSNLVQLVQLMKICACYLDVLGVI